MFRERINGSTLFVILTFAVILAGLAGVALGFIISNPYVKVLPFAILFAGLAALVSQKPGESIFTGLNQVPQQVILVLYFVVLTLVLFMYWRAGYTRPLPVVSGVFGLYLLSLWVAVTSRREVEQLTLPIGTGVLDRLLVYWVGPIQIGIDPTSHNRLAGEVAAAGSRQPLIDALSKHADSPFYHFYTAIAVETLGISPRAAAGYTTLVIVTIVPSLVIYSLVRRWWSQTAAALSSWIFLSSNYALYFAILTSPTTVGVIFYSLTLLLFIRYYETRRNAIFTIAMFVFGILAFTHQVSTLATFMLIGTITVFYTIRHHINGSQGMMSILISGNVLAFSWLYTQYHGPKGDLPSFLVFAITGFTQSLLSESASIDFPPDIPYTLAGAASLSIFQVIGTVWIISLGVLGTLYWVRYQDAYARDVGLGIGGVAGVAIMFAFGGGLAGISFIIPRRWFVFFTVPCALLAGPALLGVHRALIPDRLDHPVVIASILLLLITPAAVMAVDYRGSPDDPVVSNAPEAQRLSTTASEAEMYRFSVEYAGGDRVIADHVAGEIIERHFDIPAQIYRLDDGEHIFTNNVIHLRRDYTETEHGSFYVRYNGGSWARVYGPVPKSPEGGEIYDNGDGWLIHVK